MCMHAHTHAHTYMHTSTHARARTCSCTHARCQVFKTIILRELLCTRNGAAMRQDKVGQDGVPPSHPHPGGSGSVRVQVRGTPRGIPPPHPTPPPPQKAPWGPALSALCAPPPPPCSRASLPSEGGIRSHVNPLHMENVPDSPELRVPFELVNRN